MASHQRMDFRNVSSISSSGNSIRPKLSNCIKCKSVTPNIPYWIIHSNSLCNILVYVNIHDTNR